MKNKISFTLLQSLTSPQSNTLCVINIQITNLEHITNIEIWYKRNHHLVMWHYFLQLQRIMTEDLESDKVLKSQ